MKKSRKVMLFLGVIAILLIGCKHSEEGPEQELPPEGEKVPSIETPVTEVITVPNATDVYTWNNKYKPNTVKRNLTSITEMNDDVTAISFDDEVEVVLSNDVTANGKTLVLDNTVLDEAGKITGNISEDGLITITSANKKNLKIAISGTGENVAFYIDSKKDTSVQVLFNNAEFSTGNYPAVDMKNKSKLFIVVEGETL